MRPGLHKNQHTGSATYDMHTRRQSNGGRSLKPENLARHRAATVTYHERVYGSDDLITESTSHSTLQE